MSSGLDELERRGRWGRNEPPASRQADPLVASAPKPKPSSKPAPQDRARAGSRAGSKAAQVRRPKSQSVPEPSSQAPSGHRAVERVVIYLSAEQTAWIRERQIEALRAGKRVTTSKLLRDLMDRAMR